VLLHVRMILISDHKFPADIFDVKTEDINFDVNEEASLIITRFSNKHRAYLSLQKIKVHKFK